MPRVMPTFLSANLPPPTAALAPHLLPDPNCWLSNSDRRLPDSNRRLANSRVVLADANIRLPNTDTRAAHSNVWLPYPCVRMSDANRSLTNSRIVLPDTDRGSSDSRIRSSNLNCRLPNPHIGTASPHIPPTQPVYWSSMLRPLVGKCMMMRPIKRRRTNEPPAVPGNETICIHHFGRLRFFRHENFLRLRRRHHDVIRRIVIWHPLPVFVSFPLVVVPKNCWVKNRCVTGRRVCARNKSAGHQRDANNPQRQPGPISPQLRFSFHSQIIPYF